MSKNYNQTKEGVKSIEIPSSVEQL